MLFRSDDDDVFSRERFGSVRGLDAGHELSLLRAEVDDELQEAVRPLDGRGFENPGDPPSTRARNSSTTRV